MDSFFQNGLHSFDEKFRANEVDNERNTKEYMEKV